MGHAPSRQLDPNGLARTTSLPHPLVPLSTRTKPPAATYSHAPPRALALSPPPTSERSFTACGYGPPPTHSSIWFPAPSNGLTSEARRYRDEYLADQRRAEERDRLDRRGFLGGPGGLGARPEKAPPSGGTSMSKRMSVGKWKGAGMVGSMMARGRSWRGSKTGVELSRGGGSKRSRRGSQDVDRAEHIAPGRRRTSIEIVARDNIDGLPGTLQPGRRLGQAPTTPDPTPTSSTLRADYKPPRSRPYSETFVAASDRSRTPSFLVNPQARPPPPSNLHPSSLLPGSPLPTQTSFGTTIVHLDQPPSLSPHTVSLNTPCSETIDDPFVPPLSPPAVDEDATDRSRKGALSPTRLASLLHPLALNPGSSSGTRLGRTRSWLGLKTTTTTDAKDVKDKKPVGAGWFAGRGDASDDDRSPVQTASALGVGLPSTNASARLSLPTTPIDKQAAQWSPAPSAPVGKRSYLYSPPSDQDSSSSTSAPPPPPPPPGAVAAGLAPDLTAPPSTPSPAEEEPIHGLALTISESTHTFVGAPPLARPTSTYHLPPNMSISIQCDALIKELTGSPSLTLLPTITPSSSSPDQIYAAPHLPSPVVSQRALFAPASPMASTSPLVPRQRSSTPPPSSGDDAFAAKLGGDLSFQTPPLDLAPQQRDQDRGVSPTRSQRSGASSTLHEPDEDDLPATAGDLVGSSAAAASAPTFKRPPRSKARPSKSKSRSSLLLGAVKERLSPSLGVGGEETALPTESKRSSRLLSRLVLGAGSGGAERDETVSPVVAPGSKRASNGDWGVLMHAASATVMEGRERGVGERESRILKWRRESGGVGIGGGGGGLRD